MHHALVVDEVEELRLQQMLTYEEEAYSKGHQIIAGVDEAGRGPLAGPVVAAACIIPKGMHIPYVNDSKKLTAKVRASLYKKLIADPSIIIGVGLSEVEEIDQINIYQATIQAMLRAIAQLTIAPHCLLVDGLKLPHPTIESTKIIKGDSLSQSIAAASIIAKETRDQLMRDYHVKWPYFHFDDNKGYGTPQHKQDLLFHGPSPIHRKSFDPLKSLLASYCYHIDK
jgi:ribonuclease HII